VGAAGGTRLPDQPRPSLGARVRGVGQGLRDILHGTQPGGAGGGGMLRPTGTFVADSGEPQHEFGMDEQMQGMQHMPNPDQIVTDAIAHRPYSPAEALGHVVQPMPPVGALPPSPRPMPGQQPGMPGQPPMPGIQTFNYEGSDGAHYQMPQAGERERNNRMLEYGTQSAIKEAADDRNDQRTADRALEHDKRMVDYYDRRDETRGNQQQAHDERVAAMRARLATLTGAGKGNSPEALALRRRMIELGERREERLNTEGVARTEQGAARIESAAGTATTRGAVTDPLARRMNDRDPAKKQANDTRLSRADSLQRVATERADRSVTLRRGANPPRGAATIQTARAEEARLIGAGMTKEQARASMRAKGWPIK
jgi:hypothetical protein